MLRTIAYIITDLNGVQNRVLLRNVTFTTTYPGGYGYLTGTLDRSQVWRLGMTDPAIGYFFRLQRFAGLTLTFEGEIRVIEESRDRSDSLQITAIGYGVLAKDVPYNRIWADSRWNSWELFAITDHAKSVFNADTTNRLFFGVKKNATYVNGEYAQWMYTAITNLGQSNIARITGSYDVAFPAGTWGMALIARTNSGPTTLLSISATSSGSFDFSTSSTPAIPSGTFRLEMRLSSGAAQTPVAEDNAIYAKMTSLTVYSKNATSIYATDVAQDVVSTLSASGIGLSSATDLITQTSTSIVPLHLDDDPTCTEVLNEICRYGDTFGGADHQLAWGVWDNKKLWLERQPRDTIAYYIDPSAVRSYTVTGSLDQTYTHAYGVYRDTQGVVRRTATLSAPTFNAFGSRIRTAAIPVNGTTDSTKVQRAVQLWLNDHSVPQVQASLLIDQPISDTFGIPVPLDQVRAGKLVRLRQLRALEAHGTTSDYRNASTDFLVVATKYDEEAGTLELSPDGQASSFEQYVARVQALRNF